VESGVGVGVDAGAAVFIDGASGEENAGG